MPFRPCVSGCGRYLAPVDVTIAASRVWALSTLRWLLWTSHAPIPGWSHGDSEEFPFVEGSSCHWHFATCGAAEGTGLAGVPLVSFGAPPDDRMSIAASEGESDHSGNDDSAPLPPSGRSTVPDSDLEIVAMLAQAADRVGLKWRPPPCPEPSRLDDWFLGVARAGSQGPTPVLFFPEVHDELTGTWMAPFTARNRSSGSSSLATLDDGAARGYTEVPPV